MERREQLTEAILDWALAHGVAGLSLRPLAEALGTSTYSLVYWFGAKENLVSAALERSEERQRQMMLRWIEDAGAARPGELLRRYWRWSCSEQGDPYVRLFVEVAGLAQHGSAQSRAYVERAIVPWRALLRLAYEESGKPPHEAEREATFVLAAIVGLQVDLATSGDTARLDPAVEALAEGLDELGEIPVRGLDRLRVETGPAR